MGTVYTELVRPSVTGFIASRVVPLLRATTDHKVSEGFPVLWQTICLGKS